MKILKNPLSIYLSFLRELSLWTVCRALMAPQDWHSSRPGTTTHTPLKNTRYTQRYNQFPVLRLGLPSNQSGQKVIQPPYSSHTQSVIWRKCLEGNEKTRKLV